MENSIIKSTLNHIEEQVGLKLLLCDNFKGIQEHAGDKYFNIVLEMRTSESVEFRKLEKFANKYQTIRIAPNGLNRVAIYLK